jgi:hypothetical protein
VQGRVGFRSATRWRRDKVDALSDSGSVVSQSLPDRPWPA